MWLPSWKHLKSGICAETADVTYMALCKEYRYTYVSWAVCKWPYLQVSSHTCFCFSTAVRKPFIIRKLALSWSSSWTEFLMSLWSEELTGKTVKPSISVLILKLWNRGDLSLITCKAEGRAGNGAQMSSVVRSFFPFLSRLVNYAKATLAEQLHRSKQMYIWAFRSIIAL